MKAFERNGHWRPWHWRGGIRLLAIALLPVLFAFHVAEFRALADFGGGVDFRKFHLSGQRANAGLSPYWSAPGRHDPGGACRHGEVAVSVSAPREPLAPPACTHPNLNPPVFAALARPLGGLSLRQAWWCWWVGSVLAALAALAVFLKTIDERRPIVRPEHAVPVAAFLAYFPVSVDLELGQVASLLLLPTLLAWRAMRRGDTARAGAWLGLCAAFKPFYLLFLVALLALRARRALLAFGAAFGGLLVLGALLTGLDGYRDYLRIASGVTWTTTSWNASIEGFFARLFGGADAEPVVHAERLGRMASVTGSLLVVGWMTWWIARARALSETARADALFAATLPAMLLVSPLGWIYYFPLLLPAVWSVWQTTRDRPWARLVLGGAVLPTCIPSGLSSAAEPMDLARALGGGAIYFWCLLTLFILVLVAPRAGLAADAAGSQVDRGNIRPSIERNPDAP